MSRHDYPRTGGVLPKFRDQVVKGRGPRCQAIGCRERAAHLVTVQTNLYRGDDEVARACHGHKGDAASLLAGIDAQNLIAEG